MKYGRQKESNRSEKTKLFFNYRYILYSNITGLYHVVYAILNDIMAAFFTKVRKPGGWDKCVGPFGNSDADEYGISVKECQNTCYARLEKSGSK